jgi:rhodanese-related sulfurtransferase
MKLTYKLTLLILAIALCFAGCNKNEITSKNETQSGENMIYTKSEDGYYQISAEEAHRIMVEEVDYIILDVRTESEYNEAHIRDAVLLPDTEIIEKANDILPDKNQKILVYCRSGRRSKNASSELAAMGYTNIWEFGGIIDWPYATVTPDETN